MNQQILFNPITSKIVEKLNDSRKELCIAVPFISNFAKSILTETTLAKIKNKRILTCFDENNINSFDLETFKYFLKNDIELRYNNAIHLKLYLFDEEGYISSSNLTKSGFEDSIEITTSISSKNSTDCKSFFNMLWNESENRKITNELIAEKFPKYLLLKRNNRRKKKHVITISSGQPKIPNLNVEKLITYLFNTKEDYSHVNNNAFLANKDRETIRTKVKNGFNIENFYKKGSRKSLAYFILYGDEEKISGTGLFDNQLREVFEHEQFPIVMSYIYPPMIGSKDWNLNEDSIFRKYCSGIFEFDIKQYKEVVPIRLASYFYPENFLPIYKMSSLEKICSILGIETNAKSRGEKLYAFNKFLLEKMKAIPHNNYVKSHIAYQILYTIEVFEKLSNGESFDEILNYHKEKWIKDYLTKGKNILEKLNNDTL